MIFWHSSLNQCEWDRLKFSHAKFKDCLLIGSWDEAIAFNVIFKLIIENNSLDTFCENTVRWKWDKFVNGKSTLLQAMACCC